MAASTDCAGPKERIFHAALSVAMRKGFGKVTLNLIAHEAGLSKGGLLHHFTTKNDLIRAMLEFYANPTCLVRHVRPHASSASDFDPFVVAMLIAASENPRLLEAVQTQLTDSPEPMPGHLRLIGNLVAKFNLAAQG